MKKKLLSLVLAGAMLATTSVSAFAEDREVTVDSNGATQQVEIEGNIANANNETLPGTITVTVPTRVNFTINSTGQIEGGVINIKNKSKESVEVIAKQFTDSNPESGIIVKKSGELTGVTNEDNKRYVSLTLEGQSSIGLTSDRNATGLFELKDNNPDIAEANIDTKASLGVILPEHDLSLKLKGTAKGNEQGEYKAPEKAVSNNFTLTLKIQKAKSK